MRTPLSIIEPIRHPLFTKMGLDVHVKRDDLIHPYIMGNKWRKLLYNVIHAKSNNFQGLVTLGGAFSNHIAATAAACRENNLKSIGIIRGDELSPESNSTLRFASGQGMKFQFVSRESYRFLRENPSELAKKHANFLVLPEGGTNDLAIKGCQELVEELPETYDEIIVPVGTGGTMAGILKGLNGKGHVLGFSSLKGNFIVDSIRDLLKKHQIYHDNYQVINNFHFGGYGKVTDELIDFINQTKQDSGLLLDPIYTAKMFFGVIHMIHEGYFESRSKLLLIHTGGLQGIAGYNEFNKNKIIV